MVPGAAKAFSSFEPISRIWIDFESTPAAW